jgi:single-strand DNA-binding protein
MKSITKKTEISRKTEWHRVTAWGKQPKSLKICNQRKEVAMEVNTSQLYDDKDGVKRFITEVVANELLLLGKQ